MASAKKKSLRKRIGSACANVGLVILAVFVAVLLYSKIFGKQVFPYTVLWVLTDSMEETIPERSYILSVTVDASDVKEGDVITFRSRDPALAGSLNTHRVVEVIGNNEEFVTRGDHNPADDQYHVHAEDVVSRYVRNLPVLTFFGRLYSTPAGLSMTLIVLVAVMGVWFNLYTKKLKASAEREEKADKQNEIDRRIAEEVERLRAEAEKKAEIDRRIAEEVERLRAESEKSDREQK